MKTLHVICGLALLGACMTANAQDAYQTEYTRAIQGALANIQPSGAVVASPSQNDPNYYYNWVRDTALTMKSMVAIAFDPKTNPSLKADLATKINNWIGWELNLQLVPKLTDLGEPRFYLNGTANNEPWGRPQNDSPALRAQTAILIANEWISEGRLSEVTAKLYKAELPAATLIKRDLEYVAHHWQDQSFDLWEEEKGFHFYTLTVQKAALLKGADLANRLNDAGGASYYAAQAADIDQYLDQFFDAKTGTLRYALDIGNKPPQKTTNFDAAIILAAIETFDGKFYVSLDRLAPTVKAMITAFQKEYSINSLKKSPDGLNLGPALGRYPGDIYSGTGFTGGNPWFLATIALGELYCDMDKVNNHDLALAQFNRVLYHMNANGDLSEQFNKNTGFEQGARDLTWSYGAYITAYRACF